MPEALAVMLVLLVSVIIYVVARVQAANAPREPQKELALLEQHQAWLIERQHSAERGHWDDDMKARIAEQLAETRQKMRETAALAG